jgi:hypothetical protein
MAPNITTRRKQRPTFRPWSRRREENSQFEVQQRERVNWSRMVPEIAFVLLKCNAVRERSPMHEIANEAFATYPRVFETHFGDRKIPDDGLVLLTLNEAKRREWAYVAGNWFKGWRLIRKGLAFARDIERRREERKEHRRM